MDNNNTIHREDAHDKNTTLQRPKTQWFKVPDEITAKSFPFSGEVVEIKSTDQINEAFHTLVKHNVLSAPVWDEETSSYLGFLDIGDLLALTHGMGLILSVIPEATEVTEAVKGLGDVKTLFKNTTKRFSPWIPVTEDTPFLKVLEILAGSARRVPVLNAESGRVVKVISQSAVVGEVYTAIKRTSKLPEEFNLTPVESGIGLKPVITVHDSIPVKSAFLQMVEKNISAIGVVDERGKLFSCVSTKDIRLLPNVDARELAGKQLLNHSTREYIGLARRASELTGKSHASVVVIGMNTPLVTVIGKLAETRMHRVFIVDNDHKAVGVVSVSDVIRLLVEEAELTK